MSYVELDTVDSTNEYVKRNLDKLANLSVVRCNYQTNGKGRNGHVWESKPGENLLMSILVKDFKNPQDVHKMTQIAACSVAGLLDRYGIKAKIKWPNDIYVDDYKICGILVEAVYENDLKGVVVGIGLNVNSISGSFASMKMKTGQDYPIKTIMIAMLAFFKIYYNLYRQGGYHEILRYANDIAYLKNRKVTFKDYGLVTFERLNDDGTVAFIDSLGKKYNIMVNEISLHSNLD
ncbi:biotin--[acetyl-CoA-carboxylase] ligase [Thomasclavelia sp.]|uniref:biotin--[acetyl-CoA-carboxylase] ligase n=1 Tax=Thomasclavelia sp. TaxID=3025757 RepID=UPI0025DF9FCE|nr:biotin--[acetyl-CoA-carboxylase] ligase [Thomasclavelia sp.]